MEGPTRGGFSMRPENWGGVREFWDCKKRGHEDQPKVTGDDNHPPPRGKVFVSWPTDVEGRGKGWRPKGGEKVWGVTGIG